MEISNTEYRKTELDNGIRVVTERIPYVRSISLGVWLTVGSRDENERNNGISHFIEHMLFKGTKRRSSSMIAESLESVGGHLNAFTGKEQTCYFAHLLDEHIDIAIDVIADIITESVFDSTEMDKERRVILEELNNLEETPEELIHEYFNERVFPGHPLGYSIIGKRENIQSFNHELVYKFLEKNYTTGRLIIAVAGNVDHDDLVSLVRRNFNKISVASGNRELVEPGRLTRKNKVIENGAIQAHICLGGQSYSYQDSRKFALLVLNTLLGSGMSSRLFQNIREQHGLAYSIYSFIDFMLDTGLYGVYVGTDKNYIDDSIGLIRQELRLFAEQPVSDDELNRTKSQLKGNLMLGLEGTSSRMNRLAKMEMYLNRYYTLDETLKEIEHVTKEDLMAVANDLFRDDNMHITILKPKDN